MVFLGNLFYILVRRFHVVRRFKSNFLTPPMAGNQLYIKRNLIIVVMELEQYICYAVKLHEISYLREHFLLLNLLFCVRNESKSSLAQCYIYKMKNSYNVS